MTAVWIVLAVLLAVVLWAPLGIAGLFGWGRKRE